MSDVHCFRLVSPSSASGGNILSLPAVCRIGQGFSWSLLLVSLVGVETNPNTLGPSASFTCIGTSIELRSEPFILVDWSLVPVTTLLLFLSPLSAISTTFFSAKRTYFQMKISCPSLVCSKMVLKTG